MNVVRKTTRLVRIAILGNFRDFLGQGLRAVERT